MGDDDVEEEDRSQDLGPHFARACAVECTSTCHKSHFIQEFTGKNAVPQNRGADFVRACAVEMHINMSQEPLYYTEIYREKRRSQNSGADFVRATNACQGFTRATLYGNLQEKCRSPKPRPTLCASLRSRNACQDFTRATLCGNLQEKCVRPD